MIDNVNDLQPRLREIVRDLIARASSDGRVTSPWGAGEAYAYRRPDGLIGWGVNSDDGVCIARGIAPPVSTGGRP